MAAPRRPLGRASDAALGSRDAGSYAKVPPRSGRTRDHAVWDTCSGRPRRAPRRGPRVGLALQCGVGSGARRRRLGASDYSAMVGVAWESAAGQSEAGGVARGCQSGNPGFLFVGAAIPAYYYYYRLS